jgi:Flp pilus assembly protein TadD
VAAEAARAVDPAAYDLYLRGRHAWNQRTREGFQSAIDYFARALAVDPSFALAHVGLADAYSVQESPGRGLRDDQGLRAKAKSAAERALELDPSLSEAHTALGGVLFFGDRDFTGAEAAFRKAIALNPNYPVAHEWLAVMLAELGRDDEALQQVDTAVTLSPLEATMHQARGLVYCNAGRFDEAVVAERRALELTPQLPLARTLLVNAMTLGGNPASAFAECGPIAAVQDNLDLAVACDVAAAKAGKLEDAARLRARIEALRPVADVALAQIDAALGRYREAFARLDRLASAGNLPAESFVRPAARRASQTAPVGEACCPPSAGQQELAPHLCICGSVATYAADSRADRSSRPAASAATSPPAQRSASGPPRRCRSRDPRVSLRTGAKPPHGRARRRQ